MSSDPPPSYRSVLNYVSQSSAPSQDDERQPLLPTNKASEGEDSKLRRAKALRWLVYTFGIILVAMFIAQNAGLIRCPLNDVSSKEKARLREAWKIEQAQHHRPRGLASTLNTHSSRLHGRQSARGSGASSRGGKQHERKRRGTALSSSASGGGWSGRSHGMMVPARGMGCESIMQY